MKNRKCEVRFVKASQVDDVLEYYEKTDDDNNIGRSRSELERAAEDFLLLGVFESGALAGVAGAFWLPETDDNAGEDHLELGGTHLLAKMRGVGFQKRLLIPLRLASAIVSSPPDEGLWSAVKPDNGASRKSLEYNGFARSTDPPPCLFVPCAACKTPPDPRSGRRCCCDMWTPDTAGGRRAMRQLLQMVDDTGETVLEKDEKTIQVDCSALNVVTEPGHRNALKQFIDGKWSPPFWR